MWQQMIQDLRDAKLSFPKIAKAVGLSKGSVHDILTGRTQEPRPKAAAKLKRLHARVMAEKGKAA